MVERKRTKALNVRMTDDELSMLDAVAERDGISVSDWIRQVVRGAFRKAFGADAKPPKKPKKVRPARASNAPERLVASSR
jgi:hypothetical protein